VFLRLIAEDAPFFSLKLEYRGETLSAAILNGKPL
jgi:8-oxo-dGTP diphosphatase